MGNPFGKMKTTGGGDKSSQGVTSGFNQFLGNGLSQGLFADANNKLLQGQIGDPTSLQQYFQQGGDGGVGGGGYNSPQYQGFNPTLGQMGAPSDTGGVNNLMQAFSNYSPGAINANYQGIGPAGLQFAGQNSLPDRINNPNADFTIGLGSSAQLGNAGSADVLGQHSQAVQQIYQRQLEKDTADLRARYGTSGASNLGTAAQFAEGNYRAEALPQIAQALGQINQQERGLNLQQRGQDLQNFQGSRQADVGQLGVINQNLLGSTGFGVEQRGQDINSLFQGLGLNNQALLGARGQDLQSNQFGASLNFDAQSQNQQNQLSAAAQQLQAQGININALLQNQGMGNQNSQAFRGYDQNAFNSFQDLMSQNNQYQNIFNQGNSQFGGNYNLQNQQQMNQFGLGMGGLGAQLQQNQLAGMQQAIAQMYGSYNQNQGLNTAQRQTAYQPGWVGQVAQLGAAGAQAYTGFRNPLGGMGSQNIPLPNPINPLPGGLRGYP